MKLNNQMREDLIELRLPSEHQLKTISYIEENLKSKGVKFEGESYSDAGWFISRNIEDSKKALKIKRNEGIKFLFEMCEELFKDDKIKLKKIAEYKNLY